MLRDADFNQTEREEELHLHQEEIGADGRVHNEDELASFTLYKAGANIGMTYTMEPHRRKGLAKMATAYLAKRLLHENIPALAVIHPENAVSIQMHTNLGFKTIEKGTLMFAIPIGRTMNDLRLCRSSNINGPLT